jgi:glycosyltransferase involved in cell wall biosynthesis
LWHSVAPWEPTGYGTQTAIWVPRLARLGHEVAVSAYHGLQGAPIEWQGHKVYPGGAQERGGDVLAAHAADFSADLVITLCDVWALGDFEPPFKCKLACWAPIETEPLSPADRVVLENSGAQPIAVTRFGQQMLDEAGFDAPYIPHGIDTSVFTPGPDPQGFVIGINAAGTGGRRKAWSEQLTAFAIFRRTHPDALLYLHTELIRSAVRRWVIQQGIEDAVIAPNRYRYSSGQISQEELVSFYRGLSLYSGCSRAEGFGLPLVEAQSCGVPAVATDFSAMRETCGGWLVNGEDCPVPDHDANWVSPNIDEIVAVYEMAYERGEDYVSARKQARDFASQYDADLVLATYWGPALESTLAP